ncbi:MAG: rod shape-determining protein MreC [Candidatus Nealsonbacteria bacterium]|nr:rod shape-determining protein MreC [Candidatus Nealsonbacteria bacterium]
MKRFRFLIYIALITIVIFGLNYFQNSIKSFFYSTSGFSQRILWKAGKNTSDFFASIFNAGNLKKEKEELSCNNQELLAKISALEELRKENDELRNALGVGLEKDFNLLLAEITGKDISQDFISVNKGSIDGVSKNMPVVTGHKVLVGKISEVYKNYSKVMLLSDKKSSLDASIKEKDISGVVKGQGGFRLLFDLLPQDKELLKDDIVVSSSFGGIFPAGFLVGRVVSIRKNDIESFQQAEISPSFDINVVSDIFVITNYNI